MTPLEKQSLEGFASRLLKSYPVTIVKLSELAATGHDLPELREVIGRYARLPAAERHFILRMSGENLIITAMAAATPEERGEKKSPKDGG